MDSIAVEPTATGQQEPPNSKPKSCYNKGKHERTNSKPECPDKGQRSSSVCLQCYCYFFSLIVFTLIILCIILIVQYDPSIPTIDIIEFDNLKFEVRPESILNTKFVLSMLVDNSVAEFRVMFERGSIKMSYDNITISAGTISEFRQEPGNVTVVKVVMEGKNKFKGDLKVVSNEYKKSNDPVPLVLEVEMPMTVEVDGFVSSRIKLKTTCVLMVVHLDSQQETNLKYHSCNQPTTPNVDA